jgi:hypothetical protein
MRSCVERAATPGASHESAEGVAHDARVPVVCLLQIAGAQFIGLAGLADECIDRLDLVLRSA